MGNQEKYGEKNTQEEAQKPINTGLWILNTSTVKPQTSQTWKRLYPVAAPSENANKDNSGGSGANGILGEEEEEEEVEEEEDEAYCHCQRMPV